MGERGERGEMGESGGGEREGKKRKGEVRISKCTDPEIQRPKRKHEHQECPTQACILGTHPPTYLCRRLPQSHVRLLLPPLQVFHGCHQPLPPHLLIVKIHSRERG